MARVLPSGPSEKEFQAQVVQLAKLTGHLCYHTFDSRRSEPGFPDLVIIKPGMFRPLFVELKTESGKLSWPQEGWGKALRVCPGADYRIWRPSDWDEIEATLKGAA